MSMTSEVLLTERLLLRPPEEGDASSIASYLSEWEVAKNLSTPPHPYREEHALAYIAAARSSRADGRGYRFSICRRHDGMLMGITGLQVKENGATELGYWIGKPFWGAGYATEAARRLVDFAFGELRLEQLVAGWFFDNPGSGRVLEKAGFVYDGMDERNSLARGHAVQSHCMVLSRAAWEQTPA